jgi:hypothetical protein
MAAAAATTRTRVAAAAGIMEQAVLVDSDPVKVCFNVMDIIQAMAAPAFLPADTPQAPIEYILAVGAAADTRTTE